VFHSVRARITALSTLIVVVVLTATAFGLVQVQRRTLTSHIDETLEQYVADVVRGLDDEPIPARLTAPGDEDSFAQVATRDGRVLVSTGNVPSSVLFLRVPAGDTQVRRTMPSPSDDARVRVVARVAGSHVVLAAASLDDVDAGVDALRNTLLIVIPLVAAVFAALSWWLVGRTLSPVETIRSRVAEITDTNLDQRVPVPATDDEIARLATTMNAMLERLDAAAERQRRFVADASHELRSPLARMRSELEVDARNPGSADLAATHRSLHEEVVALNRLVDDLLHLARADAPDARLRREPVDLDDIVLREADRIRADGDVVVDLAGVSAAQVVGDREQLARAVRNLSENAARHARSQVWFSVRERAETAEVVIADDGPGIPPDQREHVFERFTRLDEARSGVDGGSGLGLPIVLEIATRHGGTIAIDDAHHPGTAFVLSIPRAGGPAGPSARS
jgi:signal transduction histidine kinase